MAGTVGRGALIGLGQPQPGNFAMPQLEMGQYTPKRNC